MTDLADKTMTVTKELAINLKRDPDTAVLGDFGGGGNGFCAVHPSGSGRRVTIFLMHRKHDPAQPYAADIAYCPYGIGQHRLCLGDHGLVFAGVKGFRSMNFIDGQIAAEGGRKFFFVNEAGLRLPVPETVVAPRQRI